MTHEEAIQCALGYAWGREDASGVKTFEPPGRVGSRFAEAYAEGYDDFSSGQRCNMVHVRFAYERWQETHGASVFPAGESTEDIRARHAERQAARTAS